MIFGRRRSGGSNEGQPFYRQWGHGGFQKNAQRSETALEILNRKYAGGEISKEEYERIKKDILN